MATAERFEKQVERTVVENVPMVRLELTEDAAITLAELVDSVRGNSITYCKHAREISDALDSAGIYSTDVRLDGYVDARRAKEPA